MIEDGAFVVENWERKERNVYPGTLVDELSKTELMALLDGESVVKHEKRFAVDLSIPFAFKLVNEPTTRYTFDPAADGAKRWVQKKIHQPRELWRVASWWTTLIPLVPCLFLGLLGIKMRNQDLFAQKNFVGGCLLFALFSFIAPSINFLGMKIFTGTSIIEGGIGKLVWFLCTTALLAISAGLPLSWNLVLGTFFLKDFKKVIRCAVVLTLVSAALFQTCLFLEENISGVFIYAGVLAACGIVPCALTRITAFASEVH
ncbi:MAG: hypothetical protein ACQESA_00940 [Patescibacteria group bacterium]